MELPVGDYEDKKVQQIEQISIPRKNVFIFIAIQKYALRWKTHDFNFQFRNDRNRKEKNLNWD